MSEHFNVIMQRDNSKNPIRLQFLEETMNVGVDSRKKYIKLGSLAICTAIVVLIVTITAVSLLDKSIPSPEFSKELKPHDAPEYFLMMTGNRNRFWFFSVENEEFVFIKSTTNKIRAFDAITKQSICLSEEGVRLIKSSYNEYPDVSHTKKWKPQAIAMDHVTKKFYIIDKATGTLNVIDMKGEYYNVVLSDLEKPHDLVLDIKNGMLFMTQESKSILRANMDGTGLITIISDSSAALITLDCERKRIFWTGKHGIMSSNYDGEERNTLAEYSIQFQGLTFFNDKLFWILPAFAHHNASLCHCEIQGIDCTNHYCHSIPFDKPELLKAVPSRLTILNENIINPCGLNNGDCTDLCLLTANGSRSCACKLGWQLNNDRKSCRVITDYILFTVDNIVKGQTFDSEKNYSFVDAILPTELLMEPLIDKARINFDYSVENHDFYFCDDRTIRKVNLVNEKDQETLLQVDSNYVIQEIAIDWLSNNLYYSKLAKSEDDRHSIGVISLHNSSFQKTLKYFESASKKGYPRSINIHPYEGKIYFFLLEGSFFNLVYIDIRGSEFINRISTKHQIQSYFTPISSIDYEKNYVYIMTGFGQGEISYLHSSMNSEMTDWENDIDLENMIESFYIYKDYIFVSDSISIYRLDKISKSHSTKVYPRIQDNSEDKISGVKVFSPTIQITDEQNRCKAGDCAQLCFAMPIKTCDFINNPWDDELMI